MLELAVFWCVVHGASTCMDVPVCGGTGGHGRGVEKKHNVAPGARHSENVRENKVYSTVLFLSCFIGF